MLKESDWEQMGFTRVKIRLCNPEQPVKSEEIELLVGTGAMYTIVSRKVLEKIGVKPVGKRQFKLVTGIAIEREIGGALIVYGDRRGYTTVIFGEEGDETLLGVTALEELGLEIDPVTKQLRPMSLLLL
jgi:clan AA aspartic protease